MHFSVSSMLFELWRARIATGKKSTDFWEYNTLSSVQLSGLCDRSRPNKLRAHSGNNKNSMLGEKMEKVRLFHALKGVSAAFMSFLPKGNEGCGANRVTSWHREKDKFRNKLDLQRVWSDGVERIYTEGNPNDLHTEHQPPGKKTVRQHF